jgi:beta-N-acetylhexosaminidase
MHIEHKIGQLLIVGLPTTHIDQATRERLEEIQPGGVLLEKANIESAEQVLELTSQIRSILKVPPLIAIDQEGGRVDRLKDIFTAMPSADLFRSSGDAASSSRMGEIVAEALRLLGFNINFAPVLDIDSDEAADNGLQGRYLGGAPGHVIALAGTYLEGLQRGGIIGVGKHFPGLGATTLDSHKSLPQVSLSRDELKERELLPYLELFSKINSRLVAVMISHAHYTAFDGNAVTPASLSKNVVNGLLRDELGFKGLVVTDDLSMGAITESRSIGEAAVMAIEAGVDMALLCCPLEQSTEVWQTMVEAANKGRITRAHISRAFDHIARIKSMVSPPHTFHQESVLRLRDAIEELNQTLQSKRQ